MLGTRGVDLDDPADQTTAAEWLEAKYAHEVEDERHREITEADIADDVTDHRPGEQGRALVETNIDDVRDVTTAHPTEHVDSEAAGRIPSADQTAADIARAQVALAEIAARNQADAIRAAEETAEAARREELVGGLRTTRPRNWPPRELTTRWSETRPPPGSASSPRSVPRAAGSAQR